MLRSFTPAPLESQNNYWDVGLNFCNQVAHSNGANNNVSGEGNVQQSVPPEEFLNTGLPQDFDYLKLEILAANGSKVVSQPHPISYEQDDIAMYIGRPYRCKLILCQPGNISPDHPEI